MSSSNEASSGGGPSKEPPKDGSSDSGSSTTGSSSSGSTITQENYNKSTKEKEKWAGDGKTTDNKAKVKYPDQKYISLWHDMD